MSLLEGKAPSWKRGQFALIFANMVKNCFWRAGRAQTWSQPFRDGQLLLLPAFHPYEIIQLAQLEFTVVTVSIVIPTSCS
jgi:hypothetical protein